MKGTPKPIDRVVGIDSIRFICALWVFFGHGAAFYFPNVFQDGSLANKVVSSFFHNFWNGPAAVIIFFVISGFCIHYPYTDTSRQVNIVEFYTRRMLRLLLPVLVAVPLSGLMGGRLTLLQDSVLWSLLAELIYYLLYPALRSARLKLKSWRGLIIGSLFAAGLVAATNPSADNYPSFGPGLNWLLGLPCWLLGCLLAESVLSNGSREVTSKNIWICRAIVVLAAFGCSVLRFHSPIGYPWTLNIFAVLAAWWLHREIIFRRDNPPNRILEWTGLWSYSLYLIHIPAGVLFVTLFPEMHGSVSNWVFRVLFVLSVCYMFYIYIEKPSHFIARNTVRIFRHKTDGRSLV